VCGSPANSTNFSYQVVSGSSASSFTVNKKSSGKAFFAGSWGYSNFIGSWSGDYLTVGSVSSGTIVVGQVLSGSGLLSETSIKAKISGTGGIGTYKLSRVQTSPGTSVTITGKSTVLTVQTIFSGIIQVGQTISGTGITPGTKITELGTGKGGKGTYVISQMQVSGGAVVNITSTGRSILTASWSGTVLTVTSVISGALDVGHTIAGNGITVDTTIVSMGTGTGGTGTYTMSSSHSAGSGSVTSFTVLPVPFHSSDAVGPGCTRDLKNCNGNGDCNHCSGTCSCYDGYGSAKDKAVAQSPTFNPDCSSKACPIGIALAMVSKSGKSLHKKVECSNNGHTFLSYLLY